jgi:hypothetical protein
LLGSLKLSIKAVVRFLKDVAAGTSAH